MTNFDRPPRIGRGTRLVAGVGAAVFAAAVALVGGGVAAADSVTATITHGDLHLPRGVAITPDGSRAYVASSFEGKMSVIDTATNTSGNAVLPVVLDVTDTPDTPAGSLGSLGS